MSLVLSASAEPIEDNGSSQQQEEDQVLSQSPTAALPRALFALQLRDSVAPSPDRERRGKVPSSSSFDQLKSPLLGTDASPFKQLHLQVQKLKEALQVMRVEKDTEIAFLKEQLLRHQTPQRPADASAASTSDGLYSRSDERLCHPQLVPWMHSITERGDIQTSRLGRHASLKSSRVLTDLQTQQQQTQQAAGANGGVALAARIAAAFLNPVLSLPYLHSIQFGADLVELSSHVGALLETESRCLSLASPVYVFGDLHGNWTDLSFFAQYFWRFGLSLAAGTFLFLGDYVDRGASSLECVAYLFAQKLLHPHKVFLLRGNHETRAVNGLEHYYGSGCFLSQCRARFGRDEGYIVWHQINHAFDRLPLAATIDDRVFCVHGGIPRTLSSPTESRLEAIRRLPPKASMDVLDKAFYDANPALRMVSDLLWGDPAREEHEAALDPATGFGPSVQRGGSAISYGAKAVADFLAMHHLSHILRAHEAHMDGVGVAKSAQVVTIFSTSKDHALGDDATCGCVLVDRDRIAAINRSAGVSQSIVRRRRSVTCLQQPSMTPSGVPVASASAVAVPCGASASATAVGEVVRGDAADAQGLTTMASCSSAATSQAAPTSTTRQRVSPSAPSFIASPTPSAASATIHSQRHHNDQDESDSTDDEAPVATTNATSHAGRRRPSRRPRPSPSLAAGDDNNQSEDEY